MQVDERACPYCAETIKAAAVKCRWCNEMLGAGVAVPAARAVVAQPTPSRGGIVCPHCQQGGGVKTKDIKQKKGISGGKATGAVLTGGLSILATGLSRKEKATQLHCKKCGMTWTAAR